MIYETRRLEKMSSGYPTRYGTKRAVQPQRMAGGLQFRMKEETGLNYISSRNKGADRTYNKKSYAKSKFSLDTT